MQSFLEYIPALVDAGLGALSLALLVKLSRRVESVEAKVDTLVDLEVKRDTKAEEKLSASQRAKLGVVR